MDRHCCDLLDDIVVIVYYYLISMDTTDSVKGVFVTYHFQFTIQSNLIHWSSKKYILIFFFKFVFFITNQPFHKWIKHYELISMTHFQKLKQYYNVYIFLILSKYYVD